MITELKANNAASTGVLSVVVVKHNIYFVIITSNKINNEINKKYFVKEGMFFGISFRCDSLCLRSISFIIINLPFKSM